MFAEDFMRGVNQKIKVFTLGTTLLFAGMASAQMLDDETYGSWGALEIEQVEEQPAASQDNFVPDVSASSTSSSSTPSSSFGATSGAKLDDMEAKPKVETVGNSGTVSWSNDATPPERIYEVKEVREDAEGYTREITSGKLITGEVRDRYPGGKVLSKVRFVEGVRHGRSLMLFENGTMLSESFYKDGKEEGDVSIFYQNGDEFVRVTFKDGVPVSGYCMTTTGLRIDMGTEQLREFKDNGKVPCASKL